jgi:hypothetical protein
MRNEDLIVYVIWIGAGVLAVALIGSAIVKGYSKNSKLTLLYWRERKFISAILSSVSLFLFSLSFDQLVRGSWQAESKAYVDDRFYELKLITAIEKATACGRVPDWKPGNLLDTPLKELCFEWSNIDNRFHVDFLRTGLKFEITDKRSENLIPEDKRRRMDQIIEQINQTMPAATSGLLLRSETRLSIAIGAVITLIFALAGSVGEAAFQLRQAQNAEEAATISAVAKEDAGSEPPPTPAPEQAERGSTEPPPAPT